MAGIPAGAVRVVAASLAADDATSATHPTLIEPIHQTGVVIQNVVVVQMAAVVVGRVRVSRLHCARTGATITGAGTPSKSALASILAGIAGQVASRPREIVEVAVKGPVFLNDKNEVFDRLLGEAWRG